MKRKYMPVILMLTAGAVTCIITFIKHYTVLGMLLALLVVLVIFYALGSLLKWVLDTFEAQNEKAALDEGEVIEKEGEEAGTESGREPEEDKE